MDHRLIPRSKGSTRRQAVNRRTVSLQASQRRIAVLYLSQTSCKPSPASNLISQGIQPVRRKHDTPGLNGGRGCTETIVKSRAFRR